MTDIDQETLIEIDNWLQEELRDTDFRTYFSVSDLVGQFGELDLETESTISSIVKQRLTDWHWKRHGKMWRRLEGPGKAKSFQLADGRRIRVRASWPKIDPAASSYTLMARELGRTMERISTPAKPKPSSKPRLKSKPKPKPKPKQQVVRSVESERKYRALQEAEERLAARAEADREMMQRADAFQVKLEDMQRGMRAYLPI